MLKFINSSLPIEKAILQAELQTISPKIDFTCPLKSIYNSDAFNIGRKKTIKRFAYLTPKNFKKFLTEN